MLFVVAGGIATEDLAGELLLCDATGTAVHRISGEARHYFEQLGDGPAELPEDEVTAALAASGVIVPFAAGVSRRRAIAMGAAAAAAVGVMSMPLPSAAQVASTPEAPSYPPRPSSGTSPDENAQQDVDVQRIGTGANAVRQTRIEWLTFDDLPITYNWRLWSPGNFTTPFPNANLIASGSATGQSAYIVVPGAVAGTTFVWLATAPDGTQTFFFGSFPN